MRIGRFIVAAAIAFAGLAPAAPIAWSQTVEPGSAQDCSDPAIAARREAFQQAYDRRDYDGALKIIEPLWDGCVTDHTAPVLKAQIVSDYTVTLHHTGDDNSCLEVLEEYSLERSRPIPATAALPPTLQKALKTNFGLCKPYCDESGAYLAAACAWMRMDVQFDDMTPGDFKARPCPFKAPEGAVALPGKGPRRCLTVTPAKVVFDVSTADEHDAGEICPGLAVVSPGGAQKGLTVPGKSLLRNKRFCCADPKLAVDRAGRIELQPAENPPEDCLFGHREVVVQDVMRFSRGRLTLVHSLNSSD